MFILCSVHRMDSWTEKLDWEGNEGSYTAWRHFEGQGNLRFCWWEFKMLVWPIFAAPVKMTLLWDLFVLQFFGPFFRPILNWQEQKKWCFVPFYQEGYSALVQKNYQIKPWHTQNVLTSYDKCALKYDVPKLGEFNRVGTE